MNKRETVNYYPNPYYTQQQQQRQGSVVEMSQNQSLLHSDIKQEEHYEVNYLQPPNLPQNLPNYAETIDNNENKIETGNKKD